MSLTAWALLEKAKRESWHKNNRLKKRIAELEQERDVEYVPMDDRQLVYLTVDDLKRIKLEQQAKGVREALTKAKWRGGGFLHECLFEDYIHDLQTQAKALKEQGE